MIVIHGENTIQSRNKLVELLNQQKEKNIIVERLQAASLDIPALESKLQKTDLFGHSRMLIIEELHSQTRSKKLATIIQMLIHSDVDICLWEKRQLTPTMLKKLNPQQIFEFKLANSLFLWLDSLSPQKSTQKKQINLFQQAAQENDAYMCLVMLIRQVRLMIQALNNGAIQGPYFVINKITRQAKQFSLDQLLLLHNQLYELDNQIKTSKNILDLTQSLELLILNLA